MPRCISPLYSFGSLFAMLFCTWSHASIAAAQGQALEEAEVGQTEGSPSAAKGKAKVDPYAVPEGSIDELFQYLQAGPQSMQPRSREDAVRMFRSLDRAAERIYTSSEANIDQRLRTANWRVMLHHQLEAMGVKAASDELQGLLDQLAADPATELQQFAKTKMFDRKISAWPRYNAEQRRVLLEEIRSGLTGAEPEPSSLMALMKLADRVAETPAAPQVARLLGEVLPPLKEAKDPAIAQRVPRLEGFVRRLQLPGSSMDVEGTLLSGAAVDWDAYRGKVVLVDYWATWCRPCIAELPNVQAAYDAYHDKGFEVLGISLDTDKEAVVDFLEARDIPWATMFHHDFKESDEGWSHPMAEKYAIGGIPRAILVDQNGKVVSMNARGRVLQKSLAKILGPVKALGSREVRAKSASAKTAAVEQ